MSDIKSMVGKKMTKEVTFMSEKVTISKLSVSEVMDIQSKAKGLTENSEEGFSILMTVIQSAVNGGKELTEEDFNGFPMDELAKLSEEIMKFSGIGTNAGK